MFYLLELREKIKKFYQEKESIAIAISKFLISFIAFYTITYVLPLKFIILFSIFITIFKHITYCFV